ncbi:MAG: Ig-like domain-containing protein [Vicinamibacterales bacterium]
MTTALVACLSLNATWTWAQVGAESRRFAATTGGLTTYPVFYHNHPVRVRGTLTSSGTHVAVTSEEVSVLLTGRAASGLIADSRVHEVDGLFLDVGRLTPGDPRLAGANVEQVSRERLNKDWPGAGELPIIVAAGVQTAEPFPAPTVRAVALTPNRYGDSQVTVSGRFRARNLYGDQPDAPGRSQWDFVISVADASVWVVGLRPRGTGFNLRIDSKIDTNEWVEVSGVVRQVKKLVVLEGVSMRLAKPVDEGPAPQTRVPVVGPPPEVLFSSPIQDDTDVPTSARVRIQFSRDLDPSTIGGRVRAFVTQPSEPGATVPPPTVMVKITPIYDEGARVLEVRFAEKLPAYATVKVQLDAGIQATDRGEFAPWSLSFTLAE